VTPAAPEGDQSSVPSFADAFIDESGQRSTTSKSSDHFVMSAVVIAPSELPEAATLLANMRLALRRGPSDEISWKKLRSHADRLKASQMLGQSNTRISSVIVCKRDFDPIFGGSVPDEDFAYLYTFRLLLERLSWLARDRGLVLSYTLAQIGQFPLAKLRRYEGILRGLPECTVEWAAPKCCWRLRRTAEPAGVPSTR
jgi:hypothetical protein